eukprot:SAG31_NODE_43349_length_267_cov_0.928571_1_plen_26_part_01
MSLPCAPLLLVKVVFVIVTCDWGVPE